MQIGAVFPQHSEEDSGGINDPGAIKAYAQAVEEMGYDYILVTEHVLGADPSVRPAPKPGVRQPRYTHRTEWHEPMVFMGYLAAITRRVGLATGVLVLGQRQAALVAKQAAEVDLLSGGRLRLGVGVGWNEVEYEALGMDYHNRGLRVEEQIALMRALWTQEAVTFKGRWHTVTAAGMSPLPVQRPIPIWLGGAAEAVVRRVARLADGWFVISEVTNAIREAAPRLKGYAREAGRDPSAVGLEGAVHLRGKSMEQAAAAAHEWRSLGATHLALTTTGASKRGVDGHIEILRRVKAALG